MNRDFVEMLDALSVAGADFLVVGAHALAAHGRPRATGDPDLWVRPSVENAHKVWQALVTFGAPLDDLRVGDLATANSRPVSGSGDRFAQARFRVMRREEQEQRRARRSRT